MPWKIKREIYLILLGVAGLVLSIIVLVIGQNASTDLLAAIGIIGGAAMVIVSLPENGNGQK